MVQKLLIQEICYPYYVNAVGKICQCCSCNMTQHDALKGFLQVKWVGIDKPEIPLLALASLDALLKGNYDIEGADVISIPLMCNTNTGRSSYMNSRIILNNTFTAPVNKAAKLVRYCSEKPYKYFSGRGILIKEEGGTKTPLLLHTASVEVLPRGLTNLHHHNLRISPSVFVDKDIVSKYISSKLLPALSSYSYSTPNYKVPTIIIEDLSEWILMPIKPKLATHGQDLKDFYNDEDTINEVINSL